MRILFRRQRQQEDHPQHDRIAVFIGADRHELKHSGELIVSDEEWIALEHFGEVLNDIELTVEPVFIFEDRM